MFAHWYDCQRKVFIATFWSSGLRQAAFWGFKWTLVMILSIIGCVSKPSVPSTWAGFQACSVGSSANMISLDCRMGLNVTACLSLIRDSCCWLQRTRTSSWTTSQSKSAHTILFTSIHPSLRSNVFENLIYREFKSEFLELLRRRFGESLLFWFISILQIL